MAGLVTYLIDAQQADSQIELDGKTLTRPTLTYTDGINSTYACDVDIGITNQQGNDQSANLLATGINGSILHNVAIAKGNSDVLYADVGSAVRLRRTNSGRYEIIGFSKSMPGTYIRTPIDLTDLSFGVIEDITLTSRPLTFGELGTLGVFGSTPFGAIALFRGTTLIRIK
jgi:hypothetical protein